MSLIPEIAYLDDHPTVMLQQAFFEYLVNGLIFRFMTEVFITPSSNRFQSLINFTKLQLAWTICYLPHYSTNLTTNFTRTKQTAPYPYLYTYIYTYIYSIVTQFSLSLFLYTDYIQYMNLTTNPFIWNPMMTSV